MNSKSIKKWEIWGAVITIIVGSILHFVFGWSGGSKIVALFGAVNESTWEHLKLAFWPTFIFGAVEWFAWGRGVKNFCFATFVSLFSMPLIIVGLFYGWLLFFPDNFIWDISIFAVAVLIGYFIGYKILISRNHFGPKILWSVLIIVGLIKFSLFTFFPFHIFLMQDPVTGGYGIPVIEKFSNINFDLPSGFIRINNLSDYHLDAPAGSILILPKDSNYEMCKTDFCAPSIDASGLLISNMVSDLSLERYVSDVVENQEGITYQTESYEIGGENGFKVIYQCDGIGCNIPSWYVKKDSAIYSFKTGIVYNDEFESIVKSVTFNK